MATRFELVLYGEDPVRLRAAGEEALREIERLEAQLSFYRPDSEIRWINARATERPVKVEPHLFRLLQECASLSLMTDGAFDITIGPLMRAWRFVNERGGIPTPGELKAARAVVGMKLIELDETAFTIRFKCSGMELDLGAYGKGYAIERAVDLLKEHGVNSALLHGGSSSVYAIGAPPDCSAWRVGITGASKDNGQAVLSLVDCGLSVSGVHWKSFEENGRRYGHVIDPHTAEPTCGPATAAAIGPSSAVCEALSTALLVLGQGWLPTLIERFPGYQGIVVT